MNGLRWLRMLSGRAVMKTHRNQNTAPWSLNFWTQSEISN
ncbi:unnamed protein product [Notodromas monacha]|uniref:Uncharacterized protein n=1 Tax=Notodromas monacha TaxID=399045 RepID=A0A7R9C2T5_9CRUS|nr:unnamed protein product [Notodromas monacha]CAG0925884.1 unnamed protein product [Notodromas monacha]